MLYNRTTYLTLTLIIMFFYNVSKYFGFIVMKNFIKHTGEPDVNIHNNWIT